MDGNVLNSIPVQCLHVSKDTPVKISNNYSLNSTTPEDRNFREVERLLQVKPYLFIYFINNTVSEKKS